MKLVRKVRVGSKLKRLYDKHRPPFECVSAFPQADRSRLQNLKCSEIALDFFKLAIEQKLDRIYQLENHRVSTGTQETNSKTIRLSTRVEKEILKKIPKIFCVNMCVESPKNHPSTRLLGYILNDAMNYFRVTFSNDLIGT